MIYNRYKNNTLSILQLTLYFLGALLLLFHNEYSYAKSTDKDTIYNHIGLASVKVIKTIRPTTIEEISESIKNHNGKVSIGGGYYSMGGQTILEESMNIDMRSFNKIISFSPKEKLITIQTGIRWRDIQEHIDPYNLAVQIMQTYANFTVGGSLGVNAHGRYIGLGPLISSVESIKVVLASGNIIEATPRKNKEIFYGAIGGYGGLGVIVEATLKLTNNTKIECQQTTLLTKNYPKYFYDNIANLNNAVLHNTNLYPPDYTNARSITWVESNNPTTIDKRLISYNKSYSAERILMLLVSEAPFGKWLREHIIDPIFYFGKEVAWRNYEAGYDIAELEPKSRKNSTYLLQEYFIPVEQFNKFTTEMKAILKRHKVNVINLSIRHSKKDPGSMLAWAQKEVFAFVIYYKQGITEADQNKVAIWTRELIDSVIRCQGTYYLPYQLHATNDQFHKAYPKAKEFFTLKQKLDPENKFSNKLWKKYYDINNFSKYNEKAK